MVLVLLVAIGTTAFISIVPESVKAGTYDDWSYHKKITIDHTLVAEDLTNFPLYLENTSANFSTNARSDGFDFRFSNATNETDFYFDMIDYDNTTGTLKCFVNVTYISSTVDTYFWIYYGNASADTDPSDRANTWSNGYLAVYHMDNTTDVCGNYDLSNQGASLTSGGIINYSYDFEIADAADNMSQTTLLDVWPDEVTFEVWFKPESLQAAQYQYIISKENGPNANYGAMAYWIFAPTDIYVSESSDGEEMTHLSLGVTVVTTTWQYGACTYKDNDNVRGYYNGVHYGDLSTDTIPDGTAFDFVLGNIRAADAYPYDGLIDEVRVSETNRSAGWINATYLNIHDPASFVTFGDEGTPGETTSSFDLKGLEGDDENITWAGISGNTVWSNSTNPGGTMEINMSINTTDNITEIRIYCDNLDASIGAGNITLYCSNYTNTTFYSFGAFTNGGSNISINQTTWDTATGGGVFNPFDGEGLKNTTTSIFCRFVLAIPSGLSTTTYSQSDWKVYLGHYV